MTTTERAPATVPLLIPGSREHRTFPAIGASKVGALFAQHPYVDLPALAQRYLTGEEDEAGEAAATGEALEDFLAGWWADDHGVTVVKPTVTFVCGRLSASPDRLIVGSTTDLLELKATTDEEGHIKPYWWWQAQGQMACTGAVRVHFAVLWGGSLTLRAYVVPRDDAAIEAIHDAAEAFFAAVELGMDPEVVGRTAEEETVALGAAEAEMVRQQRLHKETERYAAKEAKRLSAEVAALVGIVARPPGSRIVLLDSDGNRLARLRVQQGKPKMVATDECGDPFPVMEG